MSAILVMRRQGSTLAAMAADDILAAGVWKSPQMQA
jgi:hypothetical protein